MKQESKKISVSIGIPAYNEERNILHLINNLCQQEEKNILIKEILIYTDASTDGTVNLIKNLKDSRIKLKIGKTRKGQQIRQNQILKDFSGDILVILEADILPADSQVISELVKPFVLRNIDKLGMVIGVPVVINPRGFFEKILAHGYALKFRIFESWKDGNNVYSSGGHSMKALSRDFTAVLKWPENVPEDAYAYLFLKKNGLNLYRQTSAKAYMRNVTNVKDRFKQTRKFVSGRLTLTKYFPENFIKNEYNLPKLLILKHILYDFLRNPFWSSLYLLEVIINRILTLRTRSFTALYSPYQSSKKLVIT